MITSNAPSNQTVKIPQKIRTILFVCSGNICRSPFAEGLLKKLLKEGGLSGISVSSAGMLALTGTAASYNAIRVASEEGIDISWHKAREITDEMLIDADLILVMENKHRQDILRRFPEVGERALLLRNFAQFGSTDRSIFDPYGLNVENYRFAFQDIKECVMGVYQMLKDRVDYEKEKADGEIV